jgi:hypothetical protein
MQIRAMNIHEQDDRVGGRGGAGLCKLGREYSTKDPDSAACKLYANRVDGLRGMGGGQ